MNPDNLLFRDLLDVAFTVAIAAAIATAGAVAIERMWCAVSQWRGRRFASRYEPVLARALDGDADAVRTLASLAARDRVRVALLLIGPLVDDRSAGRLAATRAVITKLALREEADRLLSSRLWWRRAVALRAFGLLQAPNRTAAIVAALDDRSSDVRGAALDSLADLGDPASLPAIVVRLQDSTLHRGRRLEALTSFRAAAEPLVLDLAEIDPAHRVHYARALAICGTATCRPVLCQWAQDDAASLRAAAFMALSHVGADAYAAALAVAALERDEVIVRAAAARALQAWTGPPDAVQPLVRHLDDEWNVAVRAARSLQSIVPAGVEALTGAAARQDLAGLLSRQMLWEMEHSC